MDIASFPNRIPDEFLDENNSEYEDYLDCLTMLGEGKRLSKEETEKIYDRFTEYIINDWKKDFDKDL